MALTFGNLGGSPYYGGVGGAGIGGFPNSKNVALGAGGMLGIGEGDLLSQQLKDREDEMKKKRKLLDLQRKQYPDMGGGIVGASADLGITPGAVM